VTPRRPNSPTSSRQRDVAGEPRVAAPVAPPAFLPDDLIIPPKPPLPPVLQSVELAEPPVVEDAAPEAVAETAPEAVAKRAPEVAEEPEPAAVEESESEPEVVEESTSVSAPLAQLWAEPSDGVDSDVPALVVENLRKGFGSTTAVADLSWEIAPGTFYGIVGPNGAGKTTTLSMIAGLLRPDSGIIRIRGIDIRAHERQAKRLIGVLPDRLRTFDRLTGRQLLAYAGLLRGLPGPVVDDRVAALARALDLTDALGRVVGDYSAGMTKKVMLAAAMIHAPRLLVLDEPFEALDPVSAAAILEILQDYTANGGTVILSSHGMELIERVCDRVAILAAGQILAEGTVDELRGESTLAERFVEIVGAADEAEGLEWLHTFSG
jgi:ABC-2 type transport system ATP-binding protein